MVTSDLKYFQRLKRDVAQRLKKQHPDVGDNIKDWRTSDIHKFQEDLTESVNGRVSEKWFYTHMKADNETIPRLDILDLLSAYVGSKNWKNYKKEVARLTLKRQWFLLAVVILIAFSVFSFFKTDKVDTYKFCFINSYTKEPVNSQTMEIRHLKYHESSQALMIDDFGCLKLSTGDKTVRLAVSAAYFKSDTIIRSLESADGSEQVLLIPDDFALMVRSFSRSDADNWETRRNMLNEMMAPTARVYRMYNNQQAMQVYNKQEFIDKIILPAASFRNVEILKVIYKMDQVVELRFLQANSEEDE